MRKAISAIAVCSALSFCGCYRVSVHAPPNASVGRSEEYAAHHFIYGATSSTIDVPCEIDTVVTKLSFVDMLVGWITVGIYTPSTVELTCKAPAK
jgi:hypothetical protein